MRKICRKHRLAELTATLAEVNETVAAACLAPENEIAAADLNELLTASQDIAFDMAESVRLQGEGGKKIALLLDDCRTQFSFLAQRFSDTRAAKKITSSLRLELKEIDVLIKSKLTERKEFVFLPYKAAMWDSLESVYLAAAADPDCDAYVIPIPYYDKNADGTLGQMHYDGGLYPADIPITDYRTYDLAEHCPNAIFIHNPYDDHNTATTVHPDYYSHELKKHTDCLVYIPYYSTSGGMAEAQRICAAYNHVDYIVVQAEYFPEFFDERIPKEHFLPLGSPKLDRVIRLCQKPPLPPKGWQEKIKGKKVYFYNTSLNEAIGYPSQFFKKMDYVFETFKGRSDVCLLWRPHPLLASAIAFHLPDYAAIYEEKKRRFIEEDIGILDETPDIDATIALSDAYIGDQATSVISLFGISGKPIFALDKRITTPPPGEGWRRYYLGGAPWGQPWLPTPANELFHLAADGKYHFAYRLSDYSGGYYYNIAIPIGETLYICPLNAQDIIIANEDGIQRRITLPNRVAHTDSFYSAVTDGRYILLLPKRYPAFVRYDTLTDKLDFFSEGMGTYAKAENETLNEWNVGPVAFYEGKLFLMPIEGDELIVFDIASGEAEKRLVPGVASGCANLRFHAGDFWITPAEGQTIKRWNLSTGELTEYQDFPCGFQAVQKIDPDNPKEGNPLGRPAFYQGKVYFPPLWGNMYLVLDLATGELKEWPSPIPEPEKMGYYVGQGAMFAEPCDMAAYTADPWSCATWRLYSDEARRFYEVNLETGESREVPVEIEVSDLVRGEPGFSPHSGSLRYACLETSINSLKDFLDGDIKGAPFDKAAQIAAYREISANSDGTCGEKVYQEIKKRLEFHF